MTCTYKRLMDLGGNWIFSNKLKAKRIVQSSIIISATNRQVCYSGLVHTEYKQAVFTSHRTGIEQDAYIFLDTVAHPVHVSINKSSSI